MKEEVLEETESDKRWRRGQKREGGNKCVSVGSDLCRMALRTVDDDRDLAGLADGNDGPLVEVADDRHIAEHPGFVQEFWV